MIPIIILIYSLCAIVFMFYFARSKHWCRCQKITRKGKTYYAIEPVDAFLCMVSGIFWIVLVPVSLLIQVLQGFSSYED